MTTYKLKVSTNRSNLNIRTGPGISYGICNKDPYPYGIPKGTEITATEKSDGWFKHSLGWSSGDWLTVLSTDDSDTNSEAQPSTPAPPEENKDGNSKLELSDEDKSFLEKLNYKATEGNLGELGTMNYIFGKPCQFNKLADMRPPDCKFGRMYMETIVNDMSLLLITPGKAQFMKGFSKDAKKSALEAITKSAGDLADEVTSSIGDLITGEQGRYYDFQTDYTEYMKYVNNLCRLSAVYLGIGDLPCPFNTNKKYKEMDWSFTENFESDSSRLAAMIKGEPSVTFFIDGNATSYSESVSNSTGNSKIEDALGSGGDIAKELRFFLGADIKDDDALAKANAQHFESVLDKIVGNMKTIKHGKAVISQFADYGKTLISGCNLAIPEIWKDSSYGKSMSIEIKLVSPYGDPESIYYYILVPLFHLVALSFPRQVGRTGYMQPFIVRAFCKGWFNCNMGIIEGLSIRKAAQGGWSTTGLPTEIDVSLSLKDLYESLAISRIGDSSTFGNIEFLDFVGTMSGANINAPEIMRKINMRVTFEMNKVKDIPGNIMNSLYEDVFSSIRGILK